MSMSTALGLGHLSFVQSNARTPKGLYTGASLGKRRQTDAIAQCKKLADEFTISERHVRDMITQGRWPVYRVGRKRLILGDVATFMAFHFDSRSLRQRSSS